VRAIRDARRSDDRPDAEQAMVAAAGVSQRSASTALASARCPAIGTAPTNAASAAAVQTSGRSDGALKAMSATPIPTNPTAE